MLLFGNLFRSDLWAADNTDVIPFLGTLPHIITPSKESVPLFGPYTLRPGGKRLNQDVEGVTHAVLDFDPVKTKEKTFHLTRETALRIATRAAQYKCAIYSTFRHERDSFRFRVVFPFANPIHPSHWRETWNRLIALYPEADRVCKDVSRAYFLPSCPPERKHLAFQQWFDGPCIDLSSVAVSTPVLPSTPLPAEPINEAALTRLSDKWKRSSDYNRQYLGERLALVRDGVAFAQGGERSNTLFRLVCELVRELRNVSADVLQATFAKSLDLMRTDSQDLFSEIPGMFERAKGYLEQVAEQEIAPVPEPIATDDLEKIFQTFKSANPLRSLVLQRDSEYWVLTYSPEHGCQYVRTNKDGLPKQCAHKLRPFKVNLFVTEGDKTRRMKPDEIVERYGTPVEEVCYSFTCKCPTLERIGATHELTQPAAQIRECVKPEFNPEIDAWLRLMGGQHAEALLNWLAFSTDPGKPLVSLVLIGAKSTGKSLLAKGLANLWTNASPPKFRSAIGDFNAELMRCPLVFADEDLPRDSRGRVRTAEFRAFLQEGRHSINAKYKQPVTLIGYPRLIVAANNENVLDFGSENLSPDDLAAIQERLFVLQVSESCAQYLEKCDVGEWVRTNAIAAHALHLAQERIGRYHGRFGLKIETATGPMLFTHGIRSQVIEWIVKHVLNPSIIRAKTVVMNEEIRVFVSDIDAHWNDYLGTLRPTTPRISAALSVFGGEHGYVKIPIKTLGIWVREFNYSDLDTFFRAIVAFEERKGKLRAL